jgi:hypothetical protein
VDNSEIILDMSKGSRIVARWFEAWPLGSHSLAGMQVKTAATEHYVVGTCVHFYSKGPGYPCEVIMVDPDPEGMSTVEATIQDCSCGKPHVAIKPAWVKGIK